MSRNESPNVLTIPKHVLRAGIAERGAFMRSASKRDVLDPPGDLQSLPVLPADHHRRCAGIPGLPDDVGEIDVAEPLLLAILADAHIFRTEPERPRIPFRLRADADAPAPDVHSREERRPEGAASRHAVQPFRNRAGGEGDAEPRTRP